MKGRKRHIATNTLGNLLAVEVYRASYAIRAQGFDIIKHPNKSIVKVFADGGYKGQLIEQVKQDLSCKLEIVKRTDKGFKVRTER